MLKYIAFICALKINNMLKRIYFLIAILSLSTILVNAQVTTSGITGKVSNDSGGGLAGATITATHTPTGTVYTGTTNESGRYNLANMRVGGPYVVSISYVGYSTSNFDDITLELGQPYVLNVALNQGEQRLEEVIVTGRSNTLLRSDRTGAITTIGRQQVTVLPSINRSINDLTRLSPQANGTSVAGGNYRSNNFTVDGANFNNQFGIGQNVPAGGSPISLDALEQISINITPYDVRQTGFTGAAINAVTRSGRNEFFGNAFFTGRSDKQQGTRVGDVTTAVNQLRIKQYGISIGGPIIKNKLFFFVNAEQLKRTEPGQTKVAQTPPGVTFGATGTPSYVARPRATFLDSVSTYLRDKYNYETGPYQGYSYESYNNKLFGRIDWNISANHKINLRYSQVESRTPSSVSSSTSNSGVTFSSANNRLNNTALHFANSNYFQDDNLYAGTFEYNGRIGNYNQSFRVSYAHQYAPRSSNSSEFPLVDIKDGSSVLTTFGYEPFTLGNLRDVKTYTVNYDGSYIIGNNNLTGGIQFETSKTKNGFQRYGTGYFVFDSWSDFVNNAKPSNFAITYPLTEDGSQAFPAFKFNQLSLYLQDEYTVNTKLKLTAGLRVELPSYPDVAEIKTNPAIDTLTFLGGVKVNTGALPKTTPMFSPRFGFNYDVKGDRSIQLRGGTGIFTGRIPFVWIVSQSGDAGMLQYLTNVSGKTNPAMPNFTPNYKDLYPTTKKIPGKVIPASVSAMANDLKFPSTWKSSLAVDFKLPYGLVATVEGIYNKDINAVIARNVNLVDPQNLNVAGYADNRLIYPNAAVDKYIYKLTGDSVINKTSTGAFSAIVMDNVKGGSYWSLTLQLTKLLERGLSGSLAYTFSGAKNYGDGSGDQIVNLWSIPYTAGNPNAPTLSYTDNVLPGRLVGYIAYSNNWIGKLKTTMGLYYSGSSQGRYSWYYTTDFNRDGQTNDLIYIPKDPSEITFVDIPANTTGYVKAYTAAEQSALFFDLINSDSYLKDRKGQYAERNGSIFPWRHQFDFRLSQQLANNIGGLRNSIEVFMDIFNIGNMINPQWGIYKTANNGILAPQNTSSLVAGGTVKPTFRLGTANGDIIKTTYRNNETITSTYYMQFGIRLNFN